MKILKQIVEQWGNLTAEQCKELALYFPNTPLVIKWGFLPREQCSANQVPHRIAYVEKMQGDYCREVFIQSEQFRKLKEVLGLTNAQ